MKKMTMLAVASGSAVVGLLASAAASFAAATYDVTPVTTGFTTDVTSNLAVILPLIGGLIAIGMVIRFFRRHGKA
jgi:hypothetical protein